MSGSKLQKPVHFDSNSFNANGSYRIGSIVVAALNLKPNDVVTAIDDNEEWDAVIVYDGNHWGIEIVSEARELNEGRSRGYYEGFWWGCYYQKVFLSNTLEKLKFDESIMKQIREGLGLVISKDAGA